MFEIARAKAAIASGVAGKLGRCRPWLVFLLVVLGILSHMQVFVLAWGTTFYVVPLYLLLHLALAMWASQNLKLWESPLLWFFPPGTSHLLTNRLTAKVTCFRLLSLLMRLAAAAVPVALVVIPMAHGLKPHFERPSCMASADCQGLPPWLKQPWWSNATCRVTPVWYNQCLEEQAFYLRGWCNFLVSWRTLRQFCA